MGEHMTTRRQLNVLIVEDEEVFQKSYCTKLQRLGNCTATIATSFAEAEKHLDASRDFHLVLLDLCVPPEPGMSAKDEDIAQGRGLIDRCIARDEYPIPALLVVTGYLEKMAQEAEREKLKREFHCGELLLKNRLAPGDQEIERAVERIEKFLDVRVDGVRLTDREEYLVRRVATSRNCLAFKLSEPTEKQKEALRDSPFEGDSAKTFVAKQIIANNVESLQEYYFSFAPSLRYHDVIRRAQTWAAGPSRAEIILSFTSNKRALFFYSVAPAVSAASSSNEKYGGRELGDIYVSVCDLVEEAMTGKSQGAALISKLVQQHESFKKLDVPYVEDVLRKRANGSKCWTRAARLILKVGAFDNEPESQDDKALRRALAQNLEQIYTTRTGRRP